MLLRVLGGICLICATFVKKFTICLDICKEVLYNMAQLNRELRGRVKFPTGGKAHELFEKHDSVKFRSRQYSLDERSDSIAGFCVWFALEW